MLAASEGIAQIIFGVLVAYAAIEMLRASEEDEDEDPDYENMWLVKKFQNFYPIFPRLVGKSFFVSKKKATEIADSDPSMQFTNCNFKIIFNDGNSGYFL